MLKRLRLAARGLFNRSAVEHELDDELRFHVEKQTELYIARGMHPGDARRAALVALGGLESTREAQRQGRESRGVEDLVADARHAARALWHDKPLAVAGLVTLALGIGATVAVFSAVNAVMLRALPFGASDRIVSVWEENKPRGWYKQQSAPANYIDWSEQTKPFSGMAAYTDYATNVTLVGEGEPRVLNAAYVSGNFVDVLQIRPELGRGFDAAETWDNGMRRVMISHRMWKAQLGGDSTVIGRKLRLGGGQVAWEVIGVMPESFAFPLPTTDLWIPLLFAPPNRTQVSFRRAHWIRVVGRMKDGVTPEQANADLQRVVKKLQRDYPATNENMGAGITPIREWIVDDTGKPLLILLGASIVLLLIACANVGNLLLVHAVARARETSLRFVLGASRLRVVQFALMKSLLLSLPGGAAGLMLGWIGARALIRLQPDGMLPVTDIPLDLSVVAFAIGLITLSGLAFGLAPAIMATRQSPAEALNAGGRTMTGGGARRWARQLVVSEVALASLLLVGASLLVRTYRNVAAVPTGFDADGVLTASISIPTSRYDSTDKVIGFYRTLFERIGAQPGVASVGATRELPATIASWTAMLAIQGRPPMPEGNEVIYRPIVGDYFKTMHVPIIKGRAFTWNDGPNDAPVVIINEALAKQYFPNEDPIGKQLCGDRIPDSTSIWKTIVGVVGSERQGSLVDPSRPEAFLPVSQNVSRNLKLVVRGQAGRDPMLLVTGVRRALRDLDSMLALASVRPMSEVHAAAMSRQRFMSVLVFVFAATGVLLAIVGVFGVLAQLVQSRSREMGLRIALGAQPQQVTWLVIRNGMRLVGTGVAAGLAIAVASTSVMTSQLYGVKPLDVASYLTAALMVIVLGIMAAAIPAFRASAANPAITLRSD